MVRVTGKETNKTLNKTLYFSIISLSLSNLKLEKVIAKDLALSPASPISNEAVEEHAFLLTWMMIYEILCKISGVFENVSRNMISEQKVLVYSQLMYLFIERS